MKSQFFQKNQKNAIISVYNKEGIDEFAKELVNLGWKLYSSGGTATALKHAGLKVVDIATMVGEPILGHRVVTISREIHAGLLANKNKKEDLLELKRLKIPFFGLVCVDLYPLIEEIENPNATMESVIEKTDIGGPALLRSAAKGNRLVVASKKNRDQLINILKRENELTKEVREKIINSFAGKAELMVSAYGNLSGMYRAGLLTQKTIDDYKYLTKN